MFEGGVMKREFREYKKNKEYLICVDSDGSAMNTMEVKHRKCFGPCFVQEWGLQEHQEEALRIWNEINLYSIYRGVNRFEGLELVLSRIDKDIQPVAGLEELKAWIASSPELSNAALIRYLDSHECAILQKALRWSRQVSLNIALLPVAQRQPFDGVHEALHTASEDSDVVVISTANPDAMEEEWEVHGLAYFVNLILNQNVGSKAFSIVELLKFGYDPKKVLVIGDAMEDLEVARECGVCFYPIITSKESEAWEQFEEEALQHFYEGTYIGAYQDKLIEAFVQAFMKNDK